MIEDQVRDLFKGRRLRRLPKEQLRDLVLLLASGDLKFRFFVGDLIKHQGSAGVETLVDGVKSDVDEVRRSSVFLLGRSGGTASCVIGPLNGALRDNDPKVRKNAAIALGRLGSASSVGDLIRALDDESEVWVRPSIVLALGALGGEASVERLQRHEAEEDEEQEALAKAVATVFVAHLVIFL